MYSEVQDMVNCRNNMNKDIRKIYRYKNIAEGNANMRKRRKEAVICRNTQKQAVRRIDKKKQERLLRCRKMQGNNVVKAFPNCNKSIKKSGKQFWKKRYIESCSDTEKKLRGVASAERKKLTYQNW